MGPLLALASWEQEYSVHQPLSLESIPAGLFPSGPRFKISKWAFPVKSGQFSKAAYVLGSKVLNLWTSPSRGISQFTIVLHVSWVWVPLVLKSYCFGACLSYAGLISWGVQCGVWILHSSGRSSRLCVLSWLWAAALWVGFLVRLCLSFSYSLWCGFFFVCLI